jgi:hypothetical protein
MLRNAQNSLGEPQFSDHKPALRRTEVMARSPDPAPHPLLNFELTFI